MTVRGLFPWTSSGLGSTVQIPFSSTRERAPPTPMTRMTRIGQPGPTILPVCSGTYHVYAPCSPPPSDAYLFPSDHDELRHSIRSVLDNFRPYTRNFRILTSDFEFPEDDPDSNESFTPPEPGYWRLGLQPQWLDTAGTSPPVWRDGNVQLSLTHHAHFFEPYNYSIFNRCAGCSRCMLKCLTQMDD